MRDTALERLDRADALARAGREHEAVEGFREALALGLPAGRRAEAQLGLGACLRDVRRHDEAVAVLAAACTEHPQHVGVRFFHALALRSAGREREAFRALGAIVLDETDLRGVERVAQRALEHLD